MTYALGGVEVEGLGNIVQTPQGYRMYLGENEPPPLDPSSVSMTDLSWVPTFGKRYDELRQQVLETARRYIVAGVGMSSEAGWASWNSVNNAMARCDSVAASIKAGDTSRAPSLLNNMAGIIRSWGFSYDEQKGFLAALEELLRGIPKNLADAVKFAAEEASQAIKTVASSTAGKVGIGVALLGLGLGVAYLFRGRGN